MRAAPALEPALAARSVAAPHAELHLRCRAAATPPKHSIKQILVTSLERSAIATGSESGQVCLWCVEPAAGVCGGSAVRLSPRVILLGHTCEIAWLACCAFERSEALVSVCRSGFVNVWDPMDGRCLSSSSAPVGSGVASHAGSAVGWHPAGRFSSEGALW